MALKFTFGKYPGGERFVIVPKDVPKRVTLWMDVGENPEELFQTVALADGLRERGAARVTLVAPWIAYGRQDRLDGAGHAPAGRTLARILAGAFDKIVTLDAHSQVFRQAFGRKLVNVSSKPAANDMPFLPDIIVAPDHGATDRAKRLASRLKRPMLVLSKARKGASVTISPLREMSLKGKRVLMVDDMMDSGGTLLAAAAVLRKAGASRLAVLVSHKLKKAPAKLAGIDRFVVAYDHATKRLAPWAKRALEQAVQK